MKTKLRSVTQNLNLDHLNKEEHIMKSITKKLLAGLRRRFQQRWHQLCSRSVHRSC